MAEHLDLNGRGIRLYSARLYNHDYLWFSSFEISKAAGTIPAIHSYALSYAISNYSYGIYAGGGPRYEEDLAAMPAYATPARPVGQTSLTRFTQNAINSVTLRTDDGPGGINTPSLGFRLVLDPVWRTLAGDRDPSGFSFYVFAKSDYRLPSVLRLGKKGCPVRLDIEEIDSPVAIRTLSIVRPSHAVNPLDVQGEITAYQPVPLPPYMILKFADIQDDWFVFSGRHHKIHVPARFTDSGPILPQLNSGPPHPIARRRRARVDGG
jgi:CRISPR type I-D-associated protein Csc1